MRMVILGDSISQGLGAKGHSYAELLELWTNDQVPSAVYNMANTAMQISDSTKFLPLITEIRPTVVIVAHGVTEAIIRPKPESLRWFPRRWRKPGWMDPRPYFSRRWLKRLLQHLESAVRWRVKVFWIRTFGGTKWTSVQCFEEQLRTLVRAILQETQAHIVLFKQCGLDGRYFPGSPESLERYAASISVVWQDLAPSGRVHICEPPELVRWSDFLADHFHPNENGHFKIASVLWHCLQDIDGIWMADESPRGSTAEAAACHENLPKENK